MVFGWRRKPLITEENYSKLMTSFGRVVDLDRFVAQPAQAMAEPRIVTLRAFLEALEAESGGLLR